MTTLSATTLRNRLFHVLKRSIKTHAPTRIMSKAGAAILISEEDYESLLETLELLSTPGVFQGIREARADIKAGRTRSMKEIFGA